MTRSAASLAALALALPLLCAAAPRTSRAQDPGPLAVRLAGWTAVTGYESAMADTLRSLLPGARLDRAGNVVVQRGSGAPVRVAVCPMDEVGWVVGGVTAEGYLTLRRVGATAVGPLFDQSLEGQRVTVFGRRGPVSGAVSVRSTHLQRGRAAADDVFTSDNAHVDLGATAPAEVASLGVELLAPVARTKLPHRYGDGLLAAPWAAQRAACAALVAAVQRLADGPSSGTAVAVFARRRHFAHDGAGFALFDLGGTPATVFVGAAAAPESLNAGSVVVGTDSLLVPGAGRRAVASWLLPARYPRSPVETVALRDVAALTDRLVAHLGGAR